MIVLALPLALLLFSSPAAAQDSSRDRLELDAAAGRAIFQGTSLYDSIESPSSARPAAAPVSAAPTPVSVPSGSGRRPVRVVYPGPYGR